MARKFLFVSFYGLSCDLAWGIKREDNEVRFCILDKDFVEIGSGFVDIVPSWKEHVDWADVIIFDDVNGMGAWAEDLRKKGKLVVGGTRYTDMLEDDRSFGQEELKKYGVSILPYQGFTSFDEAIEFVKKNPARYVLKPSGEAQNYKHFLFIGEEETGQDVIQILEAYKKVYINDIKEFQLQKRVVGVEVAVGAFFNGNEFVYPINVNFEHKKHFPGNIGPSTGEMGTSMFWSMPNVIFNSTLKKLEEKLKEEKYVGYLDINCIVNGNGIYPLEFTARFGYPTISIQQDGINMPLGDFFFKLASGENFTIKTKKGFQIGVSIMMPPYPFYDPETFEAYSRDAVILFKKENYDGMHIQEVKKIDGQWLVANGIGVVMNVIGTGLTMRQAQTQAYHRVANVMIPNMYYRTDIGNRWFEDSDKLNTWGYLRDS